MMHGFLYNILPHASFEEQGSPGGNASRMGAYLPFLQNVVESASWEKSAGGFSFEHV